MQLTETQREARQYALMGLGVMCLSTLMLHTVLAPEAQSFKSAEEKQSAAALELGVGIVAVVAWMGGFLVWAIFFGRVSVHERNTAVTYGLLAANASLGLVLFLMPPVSRRVYLTSALWPLYFAIMVGTARTRGTAG